MSQLHLDNPVPSAAARPPADPFGEALHLLKLKGTFYCQSELSAPWGIEVPEIAGVMTFLVLTRGRCWLEVEGEDPIYLEQGNLAIVSRGAKHRLRSDLITPTVPLSQLQVRKMSECYETLHHGGGGEITRGMYGIVRFDHAAGQQLTTLLPNVLKIDTWSEHSDGWLQSTLMFISQEAEELRPGGETVITRLADILVIQAIRRWMETSADGNLGWLRALRDQQIGRAIIAMHRAPAHDWSVGELASTVGMSRSTFSERFTALVGQSAMRYLTQWRMQLARSSLLETSEPISVIALNLGYRSEAAFCRAFKRVFNVPPGSIRHRSKLPYTE